MDDSIALKDKPAAFVKWVSSYYSHEDISARDVAKLEVRHGRTDKPSTVSTYTPEEAAVLMQPSAGREVVLFVNTGTNGYRESFTQKIFVDSASAIDAKVVMIACVESIWECVVTPWLVEKHLKQFEGKTRPVVYVDAKDANHFIHWNAPEQTISLLVDHF
jgi:hypothetical protein